MSMNTVPERLAALRAAMAANGVAVYLIPVGDPHASEYLPCHYTSLTWFSGFHGENSNLWSPAPRAPCGPTAVILCRPRRKLRDRDQAAAHGGTRRAHRGGILRKCPE